MVDFLKLTKKEYFMKRFLTILSALLLILALTTSFAGCNSVKEKEEESEECSHYDENGDNKCDLCNDSISSEDESTQKDEGKNNKTPPDITEWYTYFSYSDLFDPSLVH